MLYECVSVLSEYIIFQYFKICRVQQHKASSVFNNNVTSGIIHNSFMLMYVQLLLEYKRHRLTPLYYTILDDDLNKFKVVTLANTSVFSTMPRQGSGWNSSQTGKRGCRQKKKKKERKEKREREKKVNI